MSNLIAKIMSREPLLDSDPHKTFKLIPVPEGHEVEFQRTEIANVVNMLFTALYGDPRGSLIPLQDCGKVYILQDGKTVSSFDPDPKPAPQFNVQGEIGIKSENLEMHSDTITLRGGDIKMSLPHAAVLKFTDMDSYNDLKADLDHLAPVNIYPWADRWNSAIAQCLVMGYNQASLSLTTEEYAARDGEAVGRYFARVRDAMLSAKEMIYFSWQRVEDDKADQPVFHVTFGGTPPQILFMTMTQTNKQALIDADVNGLVVNNVQRAIKLLNHGAYTVLMTHKLRITEAEIEVIKALFRDVFRYNVKFHFAGDLLLSMSFDVITQTGPAL